VPDLAFLGQSVVMLAVSVLMMIYLAYALLRPEKF
jgi:K+-transporting ATPase KdpF subunit